MRQAIQQKKMPNVASSSLPDAPDRDLRETRDQRSRWGLKPSTRRGPKRRKERTEIWIAIAIVAFGVGRNHYAQGLRCHSSEPRRTSEKVSRRGRCVLLSRAVPISVRKKVFCFFYSQKNVFFRLFCFLCLCLCLCLVLCFCVCVCVCVCVFVFLCFCVFLASRRRALSDRRERPEKKARPYGGGAREAAKETTRPRKA
jgi:hypothetical protein